MDIILLIVGIVCLHFNRSSLALTLLICLLTSYFQMGTNLSESLIYHNVSDSGIILFFYMILYNKVNGRRYEYAILKKTSFILSCFALFLVTAIIFDQMRGTSLISELQTFRHWIFIFFAPALIRGFSFDVLEKTIYYIFVATIIATLVLLIDHYYGTNLLGKEVGLYISNTGTEYARGAIPSTYSVLYILILLAGCFKHISSKVRYFFILLLFLSVVASMIRSMLIAVIVAIIIVLYKKGKMSVKNIGFSVIGLLVLLCVALSNSGFRERLFGGFLEIETIALKSQIEEEGTMTFRINLFEERFDYVMSSVDRALLGIGGVKESDFRPIFKIGLYTERGSITQLDTGDIAWALFILRLGVVGSVIFLCLWYKIIKLFKCKNNNLSLACWTYLIINFLLAFSGTAVVSGGFWLYMMMLLSVVYVKKEI